eukprot:TRINITY_DN6537_c1_g3_i1.p1 TRINITY_DN6537_c1_g3~~TRINITY_DN6537_c1_g3_i1.p1  ORF type:complete len:239 (+),score=61.84 TRINITY_DN6537_c1_g3_i1:41-718(+)
MAESMTEEETNRKRALAAAAAERRFSGLPISTPKSSTTKPSLGNSSSSSNVGRTTSTTSTKKDEDVAESELLPAFDRAIAAAVRRGKMTSEDAHHAPALRKAKKAVLESLTRGDNISLGALHTLKGVGHWVVGQLREHLNAPSSAASGGADASSKRRRVEAPATPQSFSWWYLGRDGKRVETRNDAEMGQSPIGGLQFRVSILHSSGRMEKAWLPDAKAPAQCPS